MRKRSGPSEPDLYITEGGEDDMASSSKKNDKEGFQLLDEPYRVKDRKVTFVVSSFGNTRTDKTAAQLLVRLLEDSATKEK